MAINGIFIHRTEAAGIVPSSQAYVAIRASIGKIVDPNMMAHWDEAGVNTKRMLYLSTDPLVKMEDNAAAFVEAISILQSTEGQAWRDNPIIININYSQIDLMWVDSLTKYLKNGLLKKDTDPKMLLYVTPKKWNSIQVETPDGEAIVTNILNKADLMVSEYGVAKPSACNHVGLVRFWEYKSGFFEFKEDGKFDHVVLPPVGDETPPVGYKPIPTVTSDVDIRLACLKLACNVEIQLKPAGSGRVQEAPIFELADKFEKYVKKEA